VRQWVSNLHRLDVGGPLADAIDIGSRIWDIVAAAEASLPSSNGRIMSGGIVRPTLPRVEFHDLS
jgi:hypothetical protein